jgi:NhaA family Na+:H+ antiporter
VSDVSNTRNALSLPSATRALGRFLATEASGGVVLLAAIAVALAWANSPWANGYERFWHTPAVVAVGGHRLELDLRHWVNDALMAIFFLVVGVEVKREFLQGELRQRRHAALPFAAALGGMVLPAVIYAAFNVGKDGAHGWGIPMATDIAFALGVLAVVAPRVPSSLRVFLLALAIVDDIGAVVVIAVFYSSSIQVWWLIAAGAMAATVYGIRWAGVTPLPVFVVLGVALWLSVHEAGVHATIAGVVMGLLVPAAPRFDREIIQSRTDDLLDVFTPASARETRRLARFAVSELEWVEYMLHPLVSFVIVPVFALANAGVRLGWRDVRLAIGEPVTIGIVTGLVLGKAAGITGASWLAVRLGIADQPSGTTWRDVGGIAALGGIGFTVSLFVTDLAFADQALVLQAKIGVLAASFAAAAIGGAFLRLGREAKA